MKDKIYVLHEVGSPSHYEGLKYYCDENGIDIVFREFALGRQVRKTFKKADLAQGIKFFSNLFFLINLMLTSGKKIVLGMAPYDQRMIFMNNLTKKHLFFYHSSWISWDGSNIPKKKGDSPHDLRVKSAWKEFLEHNCKAIFCVSEKTRDEITGNYTITCPTQVVYHSLAREIFFNNDVKVNRPIGLLCVGRVMEKKGILEQIRLLDDIPGDLIKLGIVGDGPLAEHVTAQANEKSNLTYYGFQDRKNLLKIFSEYDILLCPSKKGTGAWEELFGISIIESMVCGLVPIATDHVGPREIIEDGVSGFLIKEVTLYDDMLFRVKDLIGRSDEEMIELKNRSIARGSVFYRDNIAKKWGAVIQEYLKKIN